MLISFDDFRKTRLESTIQESSVLEAIDLHFDQFKADIAESTRLKVVLNEQYDPLCHHIMESVIDADHRQNKLYLEAYIDYCKLNFHNYIIEATTPVGGVLDADTLKKKVANAIAQFSDRVKKQFAKTLNTNRTSVDPSAGASSPPPHSHDGTEDGSAVASPSPLPVSPKAGPTGSSGLGSGTSPLSSPTAGRTSMGATPTPEPEEEEAPPAAKKGGFWRRFDTSKGNWLSRGAKGLANLVRTPLHWAANKIKGAWKGDSLPESVVNAMALLLEDASDEQIEQFSREIDELARKVLAYINKNIDSYAAALGTLPKPSGPKPTDVVAPAGDPRLNVDPGVESPAAKKLPDSTVAAATGVDPKDAVAGAAAAATGETEADGTPAVDPLATRVAYLQQHFGRKNSLFAKTDFLMGLYKILKKSERQALDNSTIQRLVAGIVSDNPEAEWKELGKPGKKIRLRIQPALEILQQAVFNCLQKFDADKKGGARLADEIIDLMRNEGKRSKVDMAGVFDRIKDRAKEWEDAQAGKTAADPTAAADPTVAPTGKPPKPKAPTAAPTPPVGDGMSAPMTPRKPGEPPAPLDKPTGDGPPIVKKARTMKVLGKDMSQSDAAEAMRTYIISQIPAFVNMPEDHPFFVSGLNPVIKKAVATALLQTLTNPEGVTKEKIEELAKIAVRNNSHMDFPPEALAYAGVEGKPDAPKGDVKPEVTPDAPKGDVPADEVKPEVTPDAPKPDAPKGDVPADEVKPKPKESDKDSPAKGILDAFLAKSAPHVLKMPGGARNYALRVAMADAGFGSEEDLEKLDNDALALLIKKKQMGVEEEPKPSDEAPKKDEPKAKDEKKK